MKSGDVTIEANFKTSPEGKPIQLEALKVNLNPESLKSGKGSMDKNAYSSLKTDKFKAITFSMTSNKMESGKIVCTGNLTVAGVTQKIDLEVTSTVQPDNSIQCKGEKKIKMTDYKVDPPTFMMGTIKTGDEITISLDVHLSPVKPLSNN
ncbi:MAG TPA: YceI family protein, partial [Cyclobacteriaceae bacterium]|nr:YceI family protein [Cyclobacteriaceae bacterium]